MGRHVTILIGTFFLVAYLRFLFSTASTKTSSPECKVEERQESSTDSIFKVFRSVRIDFVTFKVGRVSVTISIEVKEGCEEKGTEEVCTTIRLDLSMDWISGVFRSVRVDFKTFKAGPIPVTLSFEI